MPRQSGNAPDFECHTHQASNISSDENGRHGPVTGSAIITGPARPGWILQSIICSAQIFKRFEPCIHCRRKSKKDESSDNPSCRYRGVRFLPYHCESDARIPHHAQPEFFNHKVTRLPFNYPQTSDLYGYTPNALDHVRTEIAPPLQKVLQDEFRHATMNGVLLRASNLQERDSCDYCQSSILFGSCLCTKCGREFCLRCATAIKDSKGERGDLCLKGQGKSNVNVCHKHIKHTWKDLVAYTRATADTIRAVLDELAKQLSQSHAPAANKGVSTEDSGDQPLAGPFTFEWKYSKRLMDALQEWGELEVDLERSDTPSGERTVVRTTLKDFLAHLGADDPAKASAFGKGVWTLQEEKRPQDGRLFERIPATVTALLQTNFPLSKITRANGVWNLAAYFPKNASRPDLEPRVHASFGTAARQLTVEQVDVVSLLLRTSKNAEKGATWVIFHPHDYLGLRTYIQKTYRISASKDPILKRMVSLHPRDIEALRRNNVQARTSIVRQGEGVLIPAGHPYQVSYETDYFEVRTYAVRAYPLEDTAQMAALSASASESAQRERLHLKSMLWHAWKATSAMREEPGL